MQQVRVNTSAVERRAQSHVVARTVKKEWQAAWLLRAITCMDLTTLSGDDTEERVRRLCAKARQPIQHDLVEKLGIEELALRWRRFASITRLWRPRCARSKAAACAWPRFPPDFPPACLRLTERVAEIRRSVEAGANDIDVVITRAHVFGGKWQALYDEIAAFKQACGPAHMKVILGTGDLLTLRNVARASFVAMMAGADFIKTSTGKEADECDAAGRLRDDARDPRICAGNRHGGRIQAGRRNPHREAIDRMAGADEGRTRPVVDESGTVPLRSQRIVE